MSKTQQSPSPASLREESLSGSEKKHSLQSREILTDLKTHAAPIKIGTRDSSAVFCTSQAKTSAAHNSTTASPNHSSPVLLERPRRGLGCPPNLGIPPIKDFILRTASQQTLAGICEGAPPAKMLCCRLFIMVRGKPLSDDLWGAILNMALSLDVPAICQYTGCKMYMVQHIQEDYQKKGTVMWENLRQEMQGAKRKMTHCDIGAM
ncbi:hypothetical protein B0H17DRAFT_1152925 [Mycena rosella]|uniref:Uncharacterized protein n=1 Tax=Mycena rosella TaxID=1033263 RepID=A0AAD7BA04_MYCRO|nr:hypothetical protein B0H17DRAFT_1152925 [Mycena rosella]